MELFEYMQNSSEVDLIKASFEGVKNIFDGLKAKKLVLVNHHIEFYKRILRVEQDAEKTYREMAQKFEGSVKDQILTIAQEEKKHAFIINNLLELVSHPNTWVENAEFNQLEEY